MSGTFGRPPRRRIVPIAVSIPAALVLAAGALAACGGGDAGGDGAVTLRILVHSNPPTDAALAAIDKVYEQRHPTVHVELTTVPTNNFAKTQAARVAAGSVDVTEGASAGIATQSNPDYVTGAQPDFVTGVRAGNWVDLTGQPWLKNFSPGVLAQLATDGKQYAVPTGSVLYTGVFYNKEIFQQNGLQVPRTWAQFQDVARTLRAKGVNPLVIGGKDTWPAGLPMLGVVQSLYSGDAMKQLDRGLWTGSASLTDPASVEVLNRTREIFRMATPGFAGISESQATSLFASGKAAMWPDGTWNAAILDKAAPGLKYGYVPLPAADTAAENAALGGKLDFSFAVPSSSKHRAEALDWLALYAERDQYRAFISASGFIPAQPDVPTTSFVDGLRAYLGRDGFTPAWDQVFHPNSRSGDLSRYPWAYPAIAPMGTNDDMTRLAGQQQANWASSLPKR
jgi:raffinose/stachyose/melibiose transport system substrate-binding protein